MKYRLIQIFGNGQESESFITEDLNDIVSRIKDEDDRDTTTHTDGSRIVAFRVEFI